MIEDLFLESSSSRPPLRVGVVVDDLRALPPGSEVLSHLRRANFVEFVVVLNASPSAQVSTRVADVSEGTMDGGARKRLPGVFDWYQRWDRRRVESEARLMDPQECGVLIEGIPVVQSEAFAGDCDASVARIAEYGLDVLIHLGSTRLRGPILKLPRYGVWSVRWGDAVFSGTPPYFWEMVERRSLIAVTLCVLAECQGPARVLASVLTRAESYASLARNSFAPFVAARTLVLQKLHQLHQFGWGRVECGSATSCVTAVQEDRYATNPEMLWFLGTRLIGQTRLRMQLANTLEHWQVAVRPAADARPCTNAEGYRGVDAPRGHYYADPFVVEHAGRTHLFVEDSSYAADIGGIACLEIGSDGSLGEPVHVIERPYHCSYPQVIREGEQWFMVPETGFNGTVELYAAVDFPHQWRLEKVLFRGAAFDTTIVRHDGRYWFFVTLMDHVEHYCPQLFLFHSKSLTGTWTLHPDSPISRDVRTARCGGGIIRDGDRLVRVAQDGGVTYGRGLRFMEIVMINPREYVEREIGELTCNRFPGTIGVHTYNRGGGFEVVDLKRRVRRRTHLPD